MWDHSKRLSYPPEERKRGREGGREGRRERERERERDRERSVLIGG